MITSSNLTELKQIDYVSVKSEEHDQYMITNTSCDDGFFLDQQI
jgi:hypothetical protein